MISNNARNQNLDSVLAVRITTTPSKRAYPTHVVLEHNDGPVVGTVRCDDIMTFYRDEFRSYAGALTLSAMLKVDDALRVALAL